MKTKAEKLALLWETAAFYNLKNRATLGTGGGVYECLYYHPDMKYRCAIGRQLTAEQAKRLAKISEADGDGSLSHVWDELPGDLQDYGRSFLENIQTLHDVDKYWTDEGLSEIGFSAAQEIANKVVQGNL